MSTLIKKRTEKERIARNEALMGSITVTLEEAESAFVVMSLEAVPAIARIGAENRLLAKVNKAGRRMMKLQGWERSWVIDRASQRHKAPNQMRRDLIEKMRG